MKITTENYQTEAHKFAAYKDARYPYLGLEEECGEMIGKIAKSLRGDKELDLVELQKEVGDCLWMDAEIHTQHDLDLFNDKFFDSMDRLAKEDISFDTMVDFFPNNAKTIQKVQHVISHYKFNLDEILQMNIDKLQSRLERDCIKGNGDNR